MSAGIWMAPRSWGDLGRLMVFEKPCYSRWSVTRSLVRAADHLANGPCVSLTGDAVDVAHRL